MATVSEKNIVPERIESLLSKLRRRIRMYVWIEGIASILVACGVAFWLGLLLDWTFEPSPGIRITALLAVFVVVLMVAYRLILSRAFAKLEDASLALLIERKHADLHDGLLTSVELAKRTDTLSGNPEMLSQTALETAEHVGDVQLSRIFNFRPIFSKVALATVLLASVVVFGVLGTDAFGFWLKRLGLSEELWPRRAHIEVLGFPEDPVTKIRTESIARDDVLELKVHASLEGEFISPDVIELRHTNAQGHRGRDTMKQVGNAMVGRDSFQPFVYKFDSIPTDITFDVVGDDHRLRGFKLKVVDRPKLINMKLKCEYPKYMNRLPTTFDITGSMQIPYGSKLTVSARSTKPLLEARMNSQGGSEEQVQSFSEEDKNKDIAFMIPKLEEDQTLLIMLRDTDRVETREPIRVSITATNDPPPEIAVRLDGIGTAITPDARIPFVGTIDDSRYGLKECWLEYQKAERPSRKYLFEVNVDGMQDIKVSEALDARKLDPKSKKRILKLVPGEKLVLTVKGSDHYDLMETPRIGTSPPFTLDIVTPDQLRSILERRELTLRQRFESLLEKTHDTRRLLARVEFPKDKKESITEKPKADSKDKKDNAIASDKAKKSKKGNPVDEVQEEERRKLRVASASQNMAQVSQETLGVAESFVQISQELVNNRVDTEELLLRLQSEITEPLREIAVTHIPALEVQLEALQAVIADHTNGPKEAEKALRQTDKILAVMQHVLDKMLELESYNEVLDLLRAMIEDQEKLNDKTKQRQRDQLKNLLN